MEFTPGLSAFQGAIVSADNINTFAELSDRGGNEEKIKNVVTTLSNFLKRGQYITETEYNEQKVKEVREFTMYLILNADLPTLSSLMEIEEIAGVIWTVPTIPQSLMCEMIWSFHLDNVLFEIIANCNPQLSIEVANAFVCQMKYYTPAESLSKVKLVSQAIYSMICRLHFYDFESYVLNEKLDAAFYQFGKCLQFFTEPPKSERLRQLSEDDLYKYIGHCLSTIFILIMGCLNQFTNPLEFDGTEIYNLTSKSEVIAKKKISKVCESTVVPILDCLQNCNKALMDKCKQIVMDVSVDIFCAWCEYEEEGRNMQEYIGELCYKVQKIISSVSDIAEHPVMSMLQQLARKPVDLKETINQIDSNVIIEKLNSNIDNCKTWLKAAIYRENLCQDPALVEVMNKKIQVLDQNDCYKLYKIINTHLSKQHNCVENLKLLKINAFHYVSVATKYELLDEHFANNCFKDIELPIFETLITEKFNKLIATTTTDPADVLTVFLQSPLKVYQKIFNIAVENVHQSEIMLKTMKCLERYSDHYYTSDTEPCVVKITKEFFENSLDTETKQTNFIQFIFGLKRENIISPAKLLLLIVMPNLHKGLLNKDVSCINCQLNMLKEVYTIEELLEYRAPMLAMIAQVLEAVRWKINTFKPTSPSTIKLALDLQKAFFDTYSTGIPDKEANWLRSRIRNLQPINQYYYRDLWNSSGFTFVESISGKRINRDVDVDNLANLISKIICGSTLQEWLLVWESLSIFKESAIDILGNALNTIIIVEQSNHTDQTWNCILYLYRNLVHIIRYKYFKEAVTREHVEKVLVSVSRSLNIMKEENLEDMLTVLTPLFSYIVEKKEDHSVNVLSIMKTSTRHKEFNDKLNQMFLNGTN